MIQHAVHGPQYPFFHLIIEIDHHIPAEYEINISHTADRRDIVKVEAAELHHVPDFVIHPVQVAFLHKIALLLRLSHGAPEGILAVGGVLGPLERPMADVGP